MKAARRSWLVFALCALAAILGLGFVSAHALELERTEAEARARAEQLDRTRLALWRMDSWLNAQLAPEAARPSFEYQAFHGQQRAWTKGLGAIAPGEVVTPSPLLTFRSELFPLHFQLADRGPLTSPQLPSSNERDLAEASLGLAADLPRREAALAELRRFVRYQDLAARAGAAAVSPMVCQPGPVPGSATEAFDLQSRIQNSNIAKNPARQQASWNALAPESLLAGPLLPVWLDGPDGATQLVFVRRVDGAGAPIYQGFTVDWPTLERTLLAQVEDLFPAGSAALVREEGSSEAGLALRLANVPARIAAPPPAPAAAGTWSVTRTILAAAWAALLLGLTALGLTLGAAIRFGQSRARFASAVTHELRSPLTTFRLYTEMLAEGMVTDEARRSEYIATLHRESDRLARLCENVLAYARIEDGRRPRPGEPRSAADLVERVLPLLARRAEDGGMEFRGPDTVPEVQVAVDPDAVAQVLFGLCDNACKYGGEGPGPRRIECDVRVERGGLELSIQDHGPGVAAEHRAAIFRAFERGARPTGESVVPGVGLGLALGRGLARALGGELSLRPGPGACFVLRLPLC
jgi:signal transduction histidine kinase